MKPSQALALHRREIRQLVEQNRARNPRIFGSVLHTAPSMRGLGIARQLIETVYDLACAAAATRVYWQTQETNLAARALYEKLAKCNGFVVYTHEL